MGAAVSPRSILHLLLKRRSWQVWIVFFVLLLLILSRLAATLVISHDEKHWDSVLEGQCARDLAAAEAEFNGAQRTARRIATEIGQRQGIQQFLSGRRSDRTAVFEEIGEASRSFNVGIELYDRSGTLVAWGGRSGPAHRREVRIALDGQLISYVDRTPISSQLFVVIPVHLDGGIIGAILVRTTIEVSYPLNNAYINREGMAEQLSSDLGVTVEFNFSATAETLSDGRYLSATLFGIDSSKVGVVSVQRPVRSAFFEGVSGEFQVLDSLLLVVLLSVLASVFARRILAFPSLLLRAAGITALIWLSRYALLWCDVPSGFLSTGIFDPRYFASPFGSGLTKSIGEMSLTSIALALNVAFLIRLLLRRINGAGTFNFPRSVPIRIVVSVAVALLTFWILRGYGAVVRSAVFDSTLRFTDPKVLFPSFELGMMTLSLFLISFCLLVAIVGSVILVRSLIAGGSRSGVAPGRSWAITGALFAGAAFVFGWAEAQPLMTLEYRLLAGACAFGLALYLTRPERRGKPLLTTGNLFLALPLTVLLFYPLLDSNVHQRDRQRIEVLAEEVLRPVDSWFEFLVDEGLKSFITDETVNLLLTGDQNDVRRLAFTRWAQSTVCREGYTSVFAFADSDGVEVSRFSIGGQAALALQVDTTMDLSKSKMIRVREIGKGIDAMKVYAGSIPIESAWGGLIGYAKVVVAAGQQTLFRGENPAILRGASPENLETFYRPVTISEFRDGVLLTTNDMDLPIGYTLPPDVKKKFSDPASGPVWVEETIDGVSYESYYIRQAANGMDVVSLSLHDLGVVWHLIAIVKVLFYFAVIMLLLSCGAFIVQWRRGARYAFTFRDRLLLALLVTAIVPLGLLMLYGRVNAKVRLMESTARRLQDETATIAANLTDQPPEPGQRGLNVSQTEAEQIAADVGEDFNLYVDIQLQVSSRPELFEAGILDTRLSGSAYARILLGGERFYLERESIGLYEYAVGYRPVLNSAGSIVGVVSVPTLYRQDQLDEDVSRRNAFLFGVYAVVLLSVIVIATALANRIAAPIQRLTDATRKVSQGEFDVTVQTSGADGEIGELVRSFDAMIKDLKRSREELIRVQRELAWKEMAKQVAHEIKNPLTPMKLAVQHLRQTYADRVPDFDQVLDEVTKTVIDQIETLSRIASEFSTFARMPKRQLEQCDVKAILTESVQLFERDANVQFEMKFDPGAPTVLADREELRRAFINIIRNGIQAMNNSGRIIVGMKLVEQGTVVSIRDFGPGVPEEVKDRLFQPNFSTKTDGMGLGLAIVKKTIDDIGGTISIESARGEGTRVTIFLPASSSASA